MSLLKKYLENKTPIKIVRPENMIDKHKIKKILILRYDRIGDLLVSEPMIRNARALAPKANISVLLGKNNLSAKSSIYPYVNNIYLYEKNLKSILNLVSNLKREKYDLIIDLFDKPSNTSALIMKLAKPRFTLGLDKENRNCYNFTSDRLNPLKDHIVERTANLLTAFGCNPKDLDLSLTYPVSPEKLSKIEKYPEFQQDNIFGINLSGSNSSKYWGETRYIEFIEKLLITKPHYNPVIFFTKDYSAEAERIAKATGAKLAGEFAGFDEYAAGVSKCQVLLTPDTSAVHLASAFKIPCLALYNQNFETLTDSIPWFPYKTKFAYWGTKNGDLQEITSDEVIKYVVDNL